MLFNRAKFSGAHHRRKILLRELWRHLDLQVNLAHHAGLGVGVHVLDDAG